MQGNVHYSKKKHKKKSQMIKFLFPASTVCYVVKAMSFECDSMEVIALHLKISIYFPQILHLKYELIYFYGS